MAHSIDVWTSTVKGVVDGILPRPPRHPDITHCLEMLVRTYDPCVSCSVHMLNVKFV